MAAEEAERNRPRTAEERGKILKFTNLLYEAKLPTVEKPTRGSKKRPAGKPPRRPGDASEDEMEADDEVEDDDSEDDEDEDNDAAAAGRARRSAAAAAAAAAAMQYREEEEEEEEEDEKEDEEDEDDYAELRNRGTVGAAATAALLQWGCAS
jgi:hypothetical protein